MIFPSPRHDRVAQPPESLSIPEHKGWKDFSGWLLRFGFGALILAALVVSGKIDLSVMLRVRLDAPLAILVGMCTLALGTNSLRWVCLVQAMQYNVPAWPSVRVALSSNIFSFISPAGMGADAARVFYLVHGHKIGMMPALACGLIDRLIGLQTLLFCAASLAWLGGSYTTVLTSLRFGVTLGALALSGLLLGVALPSTRHLAIRLLPASWRKKLLGTGEASGQAWSRTGLLAIYLLSLVGALANLMLPVVSLHALGVSIERVDTYFGSAMVVLANALAPTPGGLGAGEAVASELLQGATGASAMLLARIMLFGVSLLLGLGYLVPQKPLISHLE